MAAGFVNLRALATAYFNEESDELEETGLSGRVSRQAGPQVLLSDHGQWF